MQTFTDVYRYRFVLGNLVAKNLKAQYRNMSLGFLWSLLNPLILATVLSVVWVVFFGAQRWFPSFILVTLIPYNFFAYCFTGCAVSVTPGRPAAAAKASRNGVVANRYAWYGRMPKGLASLSAPPASSSAQLPRSVRDRPDHSTVRS